MAEESAFTEHLIKGNFPKLKHQAHCKVNPAIQFKNLKDNRECFAA